MSSIQNPEKDPYSNLKKHASDKEAASPKLGDIASGSNPSMKAVNAPRIIGPDGTAVRSPQVQPPQKPVIKFKIKTFTKYCEDDIVRMTWSIINHNLDTDREIVLIEFGYTKKQLQGFIDAIESHDAEISAMKLKENLTQDGQE